MRGKRATFFAIYLVLLTLFMCGISIGLYYLQNKSNDNSIISPASLIELQDNQEIFNLQERNIIIAAAKETGLTNNGDTIALKNEFVEYAMKPEQEQFREFIFSNISIDGVAITADTIASDDAKKAILQGKYGIASGNAREVYRFSIEGDNLKVDRKYLGKSFLMRTSSKEKINFAVKVNYDYSKSYLISFDEINRFKV